MWQLQDQTITANGGMVCYLPQPEHYTASEPSRAPFGPKSYNDVPSQRQTLDLSITGAAWKYMTNLDNWTVEYVHKNCERLLKRKLSLEQVRELYRPLVTQKDTFPPLMRAKINTSGLRACRYWKNQETCDEPNWKACSVTPRYKFRGLWVMGSQFGWSVDIADMQPT